MNTCGKCTHWKRTQAFDQILGTCKNDESEYHNKRKHRDSECIRFGGD
ncbi:MAG TPA: hypothetical protein VFD03_05905 [Clostridia bacterium]|nr:hypothetical protein [Clostridia bacterium]